MANRVSMCRFVIMGLVVTTAIMAVDCDAGTTILHTKSGESLPFYLEFGVPGLTDRFTWRSYWTVKGENNVASVWRGTCKMYRDNRSSNFTTVPIFVNGNNKWIPDISFGGAVVYLGNVWEEAGKAICTGTVQIAGDGPAVGSIEFSYHAGFVQPIRSIKGYIGRANVSASGWAGGIIGGWSYLSTSVKLDNNSMYDAEGAVTYPDGINLVGVNTHMDLLRWDCRSGSCGPLDVNIHCDGEVCKYVGYTANTEWTNARGTIEPGGKLQIYTKGNSVLGSFHGRVLLSVIMR